MSDGTPETEPECPACEGTNIYDENAGGYEEFGESWATCDHGADTTVTQGS